MNRDYTSQGSQLSESIETDGDLLDFNLPSGSTRWTII